MRINLILFKIGLFIILGNCSALAQNTFEFWLDYPVCKASENAVEDASGNIIAIISERTLHSYDNNEITKSYILKIGVNGDTTTRHYQFGDTLFYFSNIVNTYDGGFIVSGISKLPDTDGVFLFLMKSDSSLNPIWVKQYDYTDNFSVGINKFFPIENGYILAGYRCHFPCACLYPFFIRMDNEGNVLHTSSYFECTVSLYEYLITSDNSRILTFSDSGLFPMNWSSMAVFDTSFNHLYSINLSGPSLLRFTAKWYSDSTFLLSYIGQRPGATSQDDEFYIALLDSSMNTVHINNFGALDTNDNPSHRQAFDYRHPDSIYFVGYKHKYFGYPPPGLQTWIMTGQLDAQLQPRYLHFIGGNGYYETYYILATRDGGNLICAQKYNYDTEVFDLLFLKLNNQGLLVGHSGPEIKLRKALLYPNPVNEKLIIECYISEFEILIQDLSSRILITQPAKTGKNEVRLNELSPGTYMAIISAKGHIIETNRFIKY